MAKLFVTFLLLLFVAVFSDAHELTDLSDNEVSVRDSSESGGHDPDLTTVILSSEESIESEQKEESTESNPSEFSKTVASELTETDAEPMMQAIFQPIRINHKFPRRSVPLIFRRGRHGYRHRNRQFSEFKPWRRSDRVGEISYGNDMILSGERSSFNPDVHWKVDREIPLRWSEFQRVEPWEYDSFSNERKEEKKRLHHHDFHHHHEDAEERKDADEKEDGEQKHKHKEKSGFLKRFRKFLKQFDF